jgi:hypothetical protein
MINEILIANNCIISFFNFIYNKRIPSTMTDEILWKAKNGKSLGRAENFHIKFIDKLW